MADKSVGELIAAKSVTPTDLFVLEQNGTAKKLTGQTLENWLVSFADGHGGIHSIVKHSTSGLKDTYRITLADTTTFDLIVTNGKAISSVEQTSEEGLTRTYTIAFNDNTSQTFTVTDGRSITNIEKTATNVLTDTYTISFNDGTTSTFTVKNGKGIKAFAKVSTVGLVDTYRIEYNDGTSDELTVTNGAKGDKGDNQYVWIKYASQKPTASSHSFGDVADNWIGIYSGDSATAPTDWTQYEWFQIKGEKGDTGAAATVINNVVEYQVSTSGSIIPSGSWQTNVPVVPQGQYLWTRTVTQFNTGDPVTAYSVARFGIDGAGSVSSVANISPDENGNVPLTAAHLNALSNMGGDLTGELRMNGQPISGLNAPTANDQAANMGFVNQQMKKAAPRNLLDNSDWRVKELIVNQRGQDSYAGKEYGVDRWYGRVTDQTVSVRDGDITVTATSNSYASIKQKIEDIAKYAGKTVTLVLNVYSTKGVAVGFVDASDTALAETVDNTGGRRSVICTFTIPYGVTPDTVIPRLLLRSTAANDYMRLYWAALYEGEYTLDTLPEYQPKGYENELLVCRQYDPNTGEYIGLRKFGQPRNLLDNSDFRNPVNQRGNADYYGANNNVTYGIDRWCSWAGKDNHFLKVNSYSIKVTSGKHILQKVDVSNLNLNKKYTVALCGADDSIQLKSGYLNAGFGTSGIGCYEYNSGIVSVYIYGGTWIWAALYEGEYTLDTLPEYQSKGYAVELAECRRYYRKKNNALVPGFVSANLDGIVISIENDEPFYKTPVHKTPELNVTAINWIRGSGKNITTIPGYTESVYSNNNISPVYSIDFDTAIDQTSYASVYVYMSYELVAEL